MPLNNDTACYVILLRPDSTKMHGKQKRPSGVIGKKAVKVFNFSINITLYQLRS